MRDMPRSAPYPFLDHADYSYDAFAQLVDDLESKAD